MAAFVVAVVGVALALGVPLLLALPFVFALPLLLDAALCRWSARWRRYVDR